MYDDNDSKQVKLAVIKNDLGYIKEKLNALDEKVSLHYITKEEFNPVKNIVYGVVFLILVAVVGALIALIVQPGPPPAEKTEQTKTTQTK